jgi:hypothetical protein
MDAVVFMEAMQHPAEAPQDPPAGKRRRGISPNTALIAGVGTLLLALGIGVLIGRSGEHTTASAPAPQVVTVSGAGESPTTASSGVTTGKASSGGKPAKHAKTASRGGEPAPASDSVLKPKAGVKLPPPTATVGEKCSKATAGCSKNGKFTGEFFGE